MGRRPRLLAALALLAAAFSLTYAWSRRTSIPPPRVLLVGIDGADPVILERLLGEGRLPTFARLKKEGAYGPLLSREPLLSPLLWTTLVTGRKAQDHGVLDFVEVTKEGALVPITSTRRRVPSLWNILTEFERPSGFIGWYASYPAETTRGFLVSDRMGFHQVKSARATEHATFPASLAGELRASLGEPEPDVEAARRLFLADPKAPLSADGTKRLSELARIHATTEFYRGALSRLRRSRETQLLGVYFELVDACGHLFMEDAPPRRPSVAEIDFAAFAGTVDRCYEYQDAVLGDVLAAAGRDTTTLVVSDHGFKSGDQRPRTSGRADAGLAPLWHRVQGVVFVHGAKARSGAALTGATVLDIAPTVLRILGLPLSEELAGRPIVAALAPDLHAPTRTVPRYLSPVPVALAETAADPEALEKLRALGYLGADAGRPATDDGRTATSFVNEAAARAGDGDTDGAFAAYAAALRLEPENVNALVYSAVLLASAGELVEARELLDRALRLKPDSPIVRLQRANLALREGDLAAAAREIREVEQQDDRLAHLHLLKARLHHALGRPRDALDATFTAESLTDSPGMRAEILLQRVFAAALLQDGPLATSALQEAERLLGQPHSIARGDAAMARRDFPGAVTAYEAARRESGERAPLLRKLGQALAGSRRTVEAEAALRASMEVATSDDERLAAAGDLALVHEMAGQSGRGIAVLEATVSARPRSATAWALLGAAYGRSGQLPRALRAYERSVAEEATPLACKTLASLVLDLRGERARAVALWRKSLALDPSQDDVREALRRHANDQ